MALRLYNTLSRKMEEFKPVTAGKVGIYACGPTVYQYAHIGNLRSYIFEDILRRTLLYNGFKLTHVMNITDVGHLTSDADTGEDKMLKGAKREGKTVWEIAKFYTDAFMKDTSMLNIQKPDVICKATDHIKEMITLIQRMEKNGYTYTAGGNVYFDVSKFADYGKLARLNLEEQKAGARIEVDENKRSPFDFALWFTKSKFSEQEMKWDSQWGAGYPGWHIECSAMSMKYLGEQFDIHCGGIDHIPIHHTNEIAQSEAATGKKPWVKYWMHGEFLVMDKGKMSKSAGGFLTMQTLIDKGYDPLVYRYFCLGAHYRQQLTFSFEGLDGAKNTFTRLREKVLEIKENAAKKEDDDEEKTHEYEAEFKKAIDEDLNTPIVLSGMWSVLRDEEISDREKLRLLLEFDKVLGLGMAAWKREKVDVPAEIQKLLDEREKARKEKKFALSDEIRNKIKQLGYEVSDTPEGQKVRKL
ncbi:cysteine--tRNA ligase [archaeon]|nr:cysteine--tRNA ligase [archaeon]